MQRIREEVQKELQHPVNHVLIQHYRTGSDYISEHSDKTIDIVRGTNIVNVSLGAQRTMTLRKKTTPVVSDSEHPTQNNDTTGPTAASPGPPRETQRIPLPHNSMFVMGLETNRTWLHGINRDNRQLRVKAEEERAFDGARISLTFRYIGTFISADEERIWGQGAVGKTKEEARSVVNGGQDVHELLNQFGIENHRSDFDWDVAYGRGSDLVHFKP